MSFSGLARALNMETVHVGNPGNAGELSGIGAGGDGSNRVCGAVDYEYNIGKYEVTAGQYCEFLNAVAKTDPYGLYTTKMDTTVDSYGCNIRRTGSVGTYTYTVGDGSPTDVANWANRPVNYVRFWDACRFANWLHNGQGNSDTETGAYTLTSEAITNNTVARNPEWRWAVASEDEWYKAAYHKNDGITGNYFDYATSSNQIPSNGLINPDPGNNATYYNNGFTLGSSTPYWRTEVGAHENSKSPYGTFDQCGNLFEWTDTSDNFSERILRSQAFYSSNLAVLHAAYRLGGVFPTQRISGLGFRVVQIPAYAPPPTISSITPSSGLYNSTVSITNLAGNYFQNGATVKLTKTGQSDILANNVTVVSTTQITCAFVLPPTTATGAWNVVATNPDSQSGTLTNGFTVNASPLSFEAAPTLDALADLSNGGSSVVDGDTVINVQKLTTGRIDRRGILEFHIGTVPNNAVIGSAVLELDVITITTSGNKYPALYLHGYAGNGTLEVADGQVPANLIGQSGPIPNPGMITINLDTAYIQSLLAATDYLGLLVVGDENGKQAGFVTTEGAIPSTRYAPKLTIQYTLGLPGLIQGTKFNDRNGNSLRDEGELGLAGWTIYVDLNQNGQPDQGEPSAVTNGTGDYTIMNLDPGTYTVVEVIQDGWQQTFPAGNGTHTVSVSTDQVVDNISFGNKALPGGIQGKVFNDLDGDGIPEPLEGEAGLLEWTVYLDLNGNGQHEPGEPSVITDANGDYAITNLEPGTYVVDEVVQEGWMPTFPGGRTQTVVVGPGQNVGAVNFGNCRPDIHDSDGDGLPDIWENANGLVVGVRDSFLDHDHDGLTNFEEWLRSGNPQALPVPAIKFIAGTSLAAQALPRDVAAADYNRDGHVDIAVLTANMLEVRWGLGDGTFGPATVLVPQTQAGSTVGVKRIAVGDFNWDGYLDLAVTSDTESSCVEVFLGSAGGMFVSSYYSGVLWFASNELAVADFNRDGLQDILVHNQGQREYRVISGKGDGTFAYLAFGQNAYSFDHPVLVVADLDEDGDVDFLTAGSGQVTVRLNEGSGTFGTTWGGTFYTGFANVTGGAPIDYNLDGHLDLALYAGATVAFEAGDGLGGFVMGPSIPVEAAGSDLATLDFNGDGFTDIAIATAANNLGILISDGMGGFLPARYFALPVTPSKMAVADFNHDGIQDVLVASSSNNSVVILQGSVNEVRGRVFLSDYAADVTTVPVTIEVLSSPPESHTLFLNSDQQYSFTTSLSGSYDIAVKAPHWLRRKVANVTIGTNPVDFTLINGDCDEDNEITSADVAIVLAAMDTQQNDPGFDPRADLNGDGQVTEADLSLVLGNMDQAGDSQ